ncbi:MAG: hypothetical protein GY820_04630 [Gammaproteobacteria bacterium]|nr:hypothetical protein [Gammaproteobacteria bacterium]
MTKIGSRSAEHRTNETSTTTAPKHHGPVVLTNTFPATVGSVLLELQPVNCKEILPDFAPCIGGWKCKNSAQLADYRSVRKPPTPREK